jgi:hypothetical protein
LPFPFFLFAFGSGLGQGLCVFLKLPQERKAKKKIEKTFEIFLEVNITIMWGCFDILIELCL